MIHIKIKYCSPIASAPAAATEHAAAYDIVATSKHHCFDEQSGTSYIEYGTGLQFEIPIGYVGKLFPRSSISKTGLSLRNSVGIIDPDYRGEVTFRFSNTGGNIYKIGDRIGQIRIEKDIEYRFIVVDELSETKRGKGGYGSTGQ
jgi:dUTP pyrophosphatase